MLNTADLEELLATVDATRDCLRVLVEKSVVELTSICVVLEPRKNELEGGAVETWVSASEMVCRALTCLVRAEEQLDQHLKTSAGGGDPSDLIVSEQKEKMRSPKGASRKKRVNH